MRQDYFANFDDQNTVDSNQQEGTYCQFLSFFNLLACIQQLGTVVRIVTFFNRQEVDVYHNNDDVKELSQKEDLQKTWKEESYQSRDQQRAIKIAFLGLVESKESPLHQIIDKIDDQKRKLENQKEINCFNSRFLAKEDADQQFSIPFYLYCSSYINLKIDLRINKHFSNLKLFVEAKKHYMNPQQISITYTLIKIHQKIVRVEEFQQNFTRKSSVYKENSTDQLKQPQFRLEDMIIM